MNPKESRLFVYGSLKRGHPNHRMLASALYLGEAQTADGYRLLDLGAYPALARGGNASVEGELFAVEERRWGILDRFEGSEFVRSTLVLAGGRSAFVYLASQAVIKRAAVFGGVNWPCRQ